jgi:hypothetical protein
LASERCGQVCDLPPAISLHGAVLLILFLWTLGAPRQLPAQQAGQVPPPASSQTSSAPPQTPPATAQTPNKSANDPSPAPSQPDPDPKVPQNDRILWTLPNYLTVENASSLPPITARQKFWLATEETFDPVEFGFVGLAAGVNQATNANPSLGQGLKGYGKRYALEFGDNTIENYMAEALFPSLFRQDPRYYQLGKGGFFHRFAYSATRIAVTRSDAGKSQFNFSEFIGAATAAGISNAYHPGPRTLGSNVNIWATQLAWDAVGFEMKEFWPDLHRFLNHGIHRP